MPASMIAPPPPTHIPFSSLHNQAGLISLDAARQDPAVVYRSFDRMHPSSVPSVTVTAPTPVPTFKSSMRLIPLSVAQRRREIKYRREGFEMQETRRHILAVRAGL